MQSVTTERHGDVLVVIVNNPPVNALSWHVRQGLKDSFEAGIADDGVKAIVLLLHEGGIQAPGSNYNGCTGLRGAIVPIVEKLSPDIRVVVSAHSHAAYNCKINGRVLTSGSAYGRLITHISLSVDPTTGEVETPPACNNLHCYKTRVEGGRVLVDI